MTNITRVFDGAFVKVDAHSDDFGRIREVVRTKNGIFTVAVLIVNTDARQGLFVRQFRAAAVNHLNPSGIVLEACAGRIERGETKELAALREVREETGTTISENSLIWLFGGQPQYFSPGVLEEMGYFAIAFVGDTDYDNTCTSFGVAEEGEETERVAIHLDTLPSQEFFDLKTQVLVMAFQLLFPDAGYGRR